MRAAQAADTYLILTWPDTYDKAYLHQFQPEPTQEIQ